MEFGKYLHKLIPLVKISFLNLFEIKMIFFFLEGNDILSEFAYVLTIFFVAIANILLLNVLIALFK
jgi:hypothetical protein